MAKTRGGRQRTRHSARLMAAANAVAETPSTNVERAPSVERPPSKIGESESSPKTTDMVENQSENVESPPPSTNVERAPSVERPPSVERQPSTDAVEIPSENVRSPPSVEMATEPTVKRTYKKRKGRDSEDMEEDREVMSDDDCAVVGDEDCEEVRYATVGLEEGNEDQLSIDAVPERYCDPPVGVEEANEEVNANEEANGNEGVGDGGVCEDNGDVGLDEENGDVGLYEDNGNVGLEEEECDDFEAEFGEAARDDDNRSDSDADSGDEIWDDERIPDPLSHSDDEGGLEAECAAAAQADYSDEPLRLGKTFNGPEEFKIAVLRYSLKTRYDIKLYRSQSLKIGAKCSSTDVKCPWRCYCSYDRKKHKMEVKIYDDKHACVRSGYSKMLKQGTIAWLYRERLTKNPKITKQEMVAEILREYNLNVTEDQCSKAKTKILRERKATHEEHFARIWDYRAEILRSNPETTFEIETTPGTTIGSLQRFFRLFICFKSQRDSWKHTCRPIIGIDGAFLKWDVKGHLLAAIGRDGDNRIVPIAWAVVEIENDDNWDWFLKMLSTSLDLRDGGNVSILSDKQSGLVKAIQSVIPQAEHRQCARHIMDNWKRNSHDMELQRLFWKIARSYTKGEFTAHMLELKSYNPSAYDSLLKTNPKTWSRAFFRIGSCCNDNLNNLSESFNRTIRQARRKPLLDMLEDIRRQCMVRNEKRFVIADRLKTRFTKRAHAEIEKMIAGSQFCERWMTRHNKHQIKCGDMDVTVDMNTNTCGCRKWQMTGIPCIHAASVIIGKREKVEDYVVDWYTTHMWKLTYYDGIAPVQGKLLWPRVNRLGVLPPPWRRGNPGRPNNHARRKSLFEASSSSATMLSREHRVMTCSNCQQEGHNKAGCKNPTIAPPPKRARGRPRKDQEPRNILFGQGQPLEPEPSQASHGIPSHGAPSPSQASQRATSSQVSQGAQASQTSQAPQPPVQAPQPPSQAPQPPLQAPQPPSQAPSQRGRSHLGLGRLQRGGRGRSQRGRGPSQRGRGDSNGGWLSWFQCSN